MKRSQIVIILFLLCGTLGGLAALMWVPVAPVATHSDFNTSRMVQQARQAKPRSLDHNQLRLWWDNVPPEVRKVSLETGPESNIHAGDYVGPEACRKCHRKNYEDWSSHPHRWMNAQATPETVKGDFSGGASIDYMGGRATFYREGDAWRVQMDRNQTTRKYEVRQTIGSRFFQYYIGRLIEGPDADSHIARRVNHVLPFGYWLEPREWVPVVHVGQTEVPDEERINPFELPSRPELGLHFSAYASSCSLCHTTFSLAEDLNRKPAVIGRDAPVRAHWHLGAYLDEQRPELLPGEQHYSLVANDQINDTLNDLRWCEPEEHGVTLGISCEACHLGCRDHVEGRKVRPDFHPRSPYLRVESPAGLELGRTQQNVNQVCARCHVGNRPVYAAGMSTWNSVEYSDAMLGSCYSELRCIDCHSPHRATGTTWPRTATEDDQSCVRCHQQFTDDESVASHTHHTPGSPGSRCMNCHMPRINEGLQDVVRTHTIFSPTNVRMIEANHPNACNMCHVDRPIDWTLKHLKEWYGRKYSEWRIAEAYPRRDDAAAIGWLKGENEAVRMVAVDAIVRADDGRFAAEELINALDDPFRLNRQFARIGIEKLWNVQLADFGYRFYMTREERRESLKRIREQFLSTIEPEKDASNPLPEAAPSTPRQLPEND